MCKTPVRWGHIVVFINTTGFLVLVVTSIRARCQLHRQVLVASHMLLIPPAKWWWAPVIVKVNAPA